MVKHSEREASREVERSKLFVRGINAEGKDFEEETETIDISETGISFYLSTSLWMDAHLTIQIGSSELFGADCTMKAKVVRLKSEGLNKQLVGARFD
jgi:hypothetical protein